MTQAEKSSNGDDAQRAWESRDNEWRRIVAECVGTFFLTFVAVGGDAVEKTLGIHVPEASKAIAPGLLVMAAIYAFGEVSGAHLNPAVTLSFATRGDFPWPRVPGYWAAQFAGAIVAALVLRQMLGAPNAAFHSEMAAGAGAAFAMETVLSFLLVTVILGTGQQARIVGPNAALAVGGAIAIAGLIGIHVSGGSMNPARSIGPLIVSGGSPYWWMYAVAPVCGALLACFTTFLIHGSPNANEQRTGSGSG